MKIYRNILLVIVYIRAVDGRSRVNSNSSTDIVPYNNGTVDNRALSLPFNTSVTEPPPPKTQIYHDENISDGGFFSYTSFSLTIDNMNGSDTIQYSYGPPMFSSFFDPSVVNMFNLMRDATENFWTPITDRFAKIFDSGLGFSSKDFISQGNYTDSNCDLFQDDTKKELSIHQLATVDIDNLSSTSEIDYSYNQSDDSHLFTAKQGFLIDKVTKGFEVLWDAKDYENVFCNKVFVATNESGQRFFRLYFPGDPPKLLHPVQQTPDPCSVHPKPPKLLPLQQTPELKAPLPKPVQQTPELIPLQQPSLPKPVQQTPQPKPPLPRAQELKLPQPKPVQQTPQPKPPLPRAQELKLPQPKPVQQTPEQKAPLPRAHELKPLHQTVHQPLPKPTAPTPITLNIRNMQSTNQIHYHYYDKDRIHTFTPKQGFIIDTVVKGDRQVWKSKDGTYPEKVLIFRDQNDKPVLRCQFPQAEPLPSPKPRARVEVVRR